MANTITFRGCQIRYADLRVNESGVFCRLHLTAEMTKPVAEAMGWLERIDKSAGEDLADAERRTLSMVPDFINSGDMKGCLVAQHMILTPNSRDLKKHEIQCECSDVSHFKVIRVKENESTRIELRFIARVVEAGAVGHIEQYLRKVGENIGALKVSYVKQQDLPLEGDEPEEQADEAGGEE